MSFDKNTSSSSSSPSTSSSDMEEATWSVDCPSSEPIAADDFRARARWLVKRKLLMDKISELERRARVRELDSKLMQERFVFIQESLEWEMQNLQNSMVSMEQLENLQKSFDELQAEMRHNVSRLRGVTGKWRANMKTQDEDLDSKVVKSILSLKCCPTVPEMKANSNAVSEYSSNLISVLNNIAKSDTCSPTMSRALTITTETIENLNKAFQDCYKKPKALKVVPQKERKVAKELDRDVYNSSGQEFGSTVQQQMPKLLANPERPDSGRKRLTLPQIKNAMQGAKSKVMPLKGPVKTLEKTPELLQSPSAEDIFPPAPVRSFALPNITQSSIESEEEIREVTSINQMAQEELQSPAPLGIHHPSPVKSFALPQIPQSEKDSKVYGGSMLGTETSFEGMIRKDHQSPSPVKSFAFPHIPQSEKDTNVCGGSMLGTETSFEGMIRKDHQSPSPVKSFAFPQIPQSEKDTKVCGGSMLRTGTSFEGMAQKDHQSPSTHNIHRPSPVKSFDLPQISQSVEETKVYIGSMLRTGTSFEEMAEKDLLHSVEETKVDVVPVEDLQSPSPVHTHPSSIMKRPQIQTEVKPSLQKPDKPETNKYVSAVSGNSEEDGDERMEAQMVVIDIKAQENNLKNLDQAFQNNNISSEMYNLCRGNVSQMLQSVDLRLGCLLRRYIRHVQLKQLRKRLDENFKLTRNLKDGLAFKKVHSQLCKFDHFQQTVRKVLNTKQASVDETRKWCITRTAHLYQQMNSIHGLHLTGMSYVQRHIPLHLLNVIPVRFSTHLCPSPPQHPQTARSRALGGRRWPLLLGHYSKGAIGVHTACCPATIVKEPLVSIRPAAGAL